MWQLYVPNVRGRNGAVVVPQNSAYAFTAADFGFSELTGGSYTLSAVKIVSLPAYGSLANNGSAVSVGQYISASDIANGRLVYNPATNGTGMPYANFTFQVQDNGGTSGGRGDTDPDPKTLTISVTPAGYVNTAPNGTDNTLSAAANTAYVFSASDFGFSDPGKPASGLRAVKITSLPSSGMLLDEGSVVTTGQFVDAADLNAGWLVYTPADNSSGTATASFTFQVQNDGGTANGGADTDPSAKTLTFNITQASTFATGYNTAVSLTGTDPEGLFANATNFNQSNLAITAVSGGTVGSAITTSQGTLTVNSDGSFIFTPATNFLGTFTFTYSYGDGTLTGSGSVTVDVTDVADFDSDFSSLKNQTLTISADTQGLLNFATAASGASITVSAVNGSANNVGTSFSLSHGTLDVSSTGAFTFTPTTGYTGDQTFTVNVSDGTDTQTSTVTVHVTQVLAADAEFSVQHDQTLTVSAGSGLVAYGTDADGASLTVSAVDGATGGVGSSVATELGGTVTVAANGSFVYNPPAGVTGDDLFPYTVSNGSATSTAIVVIHVDPSAAVDSVEVNGGAPAYTDSNGLSYNLAGQNSVVEQILVTFNQAVTLDAGAFTITNLASSVTVVSGAAPSTDAVTASFAVVPGSGNTQFIVTFSGAGTIAIPGGTGNVIKDGVYQLNTIGAHVHANGFTAPADNHVIFWALYGSVVTADNTTSGGTSEVVVDNYDYSAFVAAYGSESDIPSGTPAYNVALDGDLNGFIDNFDYSEFGGNFGADWMFSIDPPA